MGAFEFFGKAVRFHWLGKPEGGVLTGRLPAEAKKK